MSQSRARAGRNSPNGTSESSQRSEAQEVAPPVESDSPEQPEQFQHPAVLVYRVPGEQPGQEKVEVTPINGMDVFAVPSVLRFAANYYEQKLGIRKGD